MACQNLPRLKDFVGTAVSRHSKPSSNRATRTTNYADRTQKREKTPRPSPIPINSTRTATPMTTGTLAKRPPQITRASLVERQYQAPQGRTQSTGISLRRDEKRGVHRCNLGRCHPKKQISSNLTTGELKMCTPASLPTKLKPARTVRDPSCST